MKELDDNTLLKFLTGNCSDSEYEEIRNWINEGDDNARRLFQMEELYHLGKFDQYADSKRIDRAEQKLFRQIAIEEQKGKKKKIQIRRWTQFAAAIAVLVVIVGGARLWSFYTDPVNTLIVETNAENIAKEVLLADGTRVWINSASTLSYPSTFSDTERIVYVEGEAYFEVAKDLNKPFIVESEALNVKVLGTTFNFKSHQELLVAEASLIEGEIEVKGNNNEGMITLSPGQKAELNKMNRRLTVRQVDAKLDAVWKDDLIPFEKSNIFQITQTLERFYNVKIILAPDISPDATYTGTLKRKNTIDSVLESLTNSIPIKYRIVGNNIFISPDK